MYIQEKDLKLNKGYYKQRKYLPYEGKLMLAKRRIIEWYDYWGRTGICQLQRRSGLHGVAGASHE